MSDSSNPGRRHFHLDASPSNSPPSPLPHCASETRPTAAGQVLPGVRTLPLGDDTCELFSRAVRLVKHRTDDFDLVRSWLDRHYSEGALRDLCRRAYRHRFALEFSSLRRNSITYWRRLDIQRGRPVQSLVQETIEVARFRGRRLEGAAVVTRSRPAGTVIDETNAHQVWAWEDERYRRQFQEIKSRRPRRGEAAVSDGDHPEAPHWRIRRAVDDLVETEYPDGPAHVEHSRRVVAIAGLLMPEPLPSLGELGAWPFASQHRAPTSGATGDCLADATAATFAVTTQAPHDYAPTVIDPRVIGREEILFERMPGEPRAVRTWFPLDSLISLLCVAVDELEAIPEPTATQAPAQPVAAEPGTSAAVKASAAKRARKKSRVRDMTEEQLMAELSVVLRNNPDIPLSQAAVLIGCHKSTLTRRYDKDKIFRQWWDAQAGVVDRNAVASSHQRSHQVRAQRIAQNGSDDD